MKQLGKRLVRDEPSEADLAMLEAVLAHYTGVALAAERQVRALVSATRPDLDAVVVSRAKTTGTLVQKLQRETHLQLSTIDDLAGVRVVANMDLADQDDVVRRLARAFGVDRSRVRDRRTAPSHGYRAVHLLAKSDGAPVEIQVRTFLQSRWAEVYESVADVWGRQIRYGGQPDAADEQEASQRRHFLDALLQMSKTIRGWEQLRVDVLRGRVDNLRAEERRLRGRRTRASLEEQTQLRILIAERLRDHADLEAAADSGQAKLRAELEELGARAAGMAELARSST